MRRASWLALCCVASIFSVPAAQVSASNGGGVFFATVAGHFLKSSGSTELSLPDDGVISTRVAVKVVDCPQVHSVRLSGAVNSPLTVAVNAENSDAVFEDVRLTAGSNTLSVIGLNGGQQEVGTGDSASLSVTSRTVSCFLELQTETDLVFFENEPGSLSGHVGVRVVSSSVASLELSGGGLGTPRTASVAAPGNVWFEGVPFLIGSNTFTLKSFNVSGGLIDTQTTLMSGSASTAPTEKDQKETKTTIDKKGGVSVCVTNCQSASTPLTKWICITIRTGTPPNTSDDIKCKSVPKGQSTKHESGKLPSGSTRTVIVDVDSVQTKCESVTTTAK